MFSNGNAIPAGYIGNCNARCFCRISINAIHTTAMLMNKFQFWCGGNIISRNLLASQYQYFNISDLICQSSVRIDRAQSHVLPQLTFQHFHNR